MRMGLEGGEMAKPFTREEADGLRQLFGKSIPGAEEMLERLARNKIRLPSGVTHETLKRYKKIAQDQINQNLDKRVSRS